MNNIVRKLFLVVIALIVSTTAANAFIDSYTIDRDKLPEEAQQMLKEHFPKAKVSMIKVDRHLLKKTDYDVKLTNGAKIEFSNKGKWKTVECGKKTVPQDLVPSTIRKYVEKNHADLSVVSIRKGGKGYDIRLSDGVRLKFNLLCQFKGVVSDDAPDVEENEAENDEIADDGGVVADM